MRQKHNIFTNIDLTLVGLYLALVFMGWLNIYAATYDIEHESIFDFSQSYGRQLIFIILAFFVAAAVLVLDTQFFTVFANSIYGFGMFLLLSVLLFGKVIKGAKSWIILGPISIQPSEIAKYGTALAMTKLLSLHNVKLNNWSTRLKAFGILALPALLIMLQPDTGSVLVFASFVFVMYREGLSGNILLLGVVAVFFFILSILLKGTYVDLPFGLQASGKIIFMAVLSLIAGAIFALIKKYKRALLIVAGSLVLSIGYIQSIDFIFEDVLSPHQKDRINELLGVTYSPTGAGYNVHQSKIAIGSGGFGGKGFLEGTQTKFNFVPEQSTDFIFCTVGEEWGFVGSFVVISLFMTLIVRLIFIAERQRSKFSRVYGYCVASILFFHFLVNIGMTIGLAPVIGIPLPFFSYGGSSLWAFTILLFTFIKLDSDRKHIL